MSEHLELETNNTRGSGIWFRARAGANIGTHDVVYVGADGLIYPANAGAAATMPAMGLAIFAIPSGMYGEVLSRGFIGDTSWAWNPGAILYVTTAAGAMSETAPILPQQVAIALSATQIYFDAEGETLGVASGCPILEGATAYVGEDSCKSPFTNYFYTGDYGTHTLLLAAVVDYVATLGGGSISLEAMTFDGRLIVDEDEVEVFGQGWDTIINETVETGNAIYVTGDRCVIRDLQCGTTAGGGNLFNGIESTGEDLLVDNVFVNGSDDVGILLGGPRNKVTNCYVYDADAYGIGVGDTGDGSIISNNIIHQSGDDGILINGPAENCVVEGNVITGWVNEAIDDDSGTASIGDDNWAGAGSYETQTGIIAVPIVTAGGSWQGRTIEVYNSDEERYFAWTYNDAKYRGVEYL